MARDKIHEAVKNALIKDGWTITHDPYELVYEGKRGWVDLAANKPFTAEKGSQKILVEIKSFLSRSAIKDFQQALGQYVLYKTWLDLSNSEYQIFLAVSNFTYPKLFVQKGVSDVRQAQKMSVVIIDLATEEIVQWIE